MFGKAQLMNLPVFMLNNFQLYNCIVIEPPGNMLFLINLINHCSLTRVEISYEIYETSLWRVSKARFIDFVWNDHECKTVYRMTVLNWTFWPF